MDAINEMIKKLHWNIPQEEQQVAKKYILENIRDDQLHLLIQPLDKSYWDDAALLLKELGFPRVRPVLPQLLEWLKDLNWPGSFVIADLLVEIGEPMTPYLLAVFKSPETDWIYYTLKYVVLRAGKEVVVHLLTQLEELTEIESDDIDLVVVEIFLFYELKSLDTLASWCRGKINTYSQNENYRLDEIKEILNGIETSF